jgi:hypothetical protein
MESARLNTRYDEPTLTQMLSWGIFAVILVALLVYALVAAVASALG